MSYPTGLPCPKCGSTDTMMQGGRPYADWPWCVYWICDDCRYHTNDYYGTKAGEKAATIEWTTDVVDDKQVHCYRDQRISRDPQLSLL